MYLGTVVYIEEERGVRKGYGSKGKRKRKRGTSLHLWDMCMVRVVVQTSSGWLSNTVACRKTIIFVYHFTRRNCLVQFDPLWKKARKGNEVLRVGLMEQMNKKCDIKSCYYMEKMK